VWVGTWSLPWSGCLHPVEAHKPILPVDANDKLEEAPSMHTKPHRSTARVPAIVAGSASTPPPISDDAGVAATDAAHG
jgi:hypothetical protein